jgi:hypothetical protein
MKNKNMKNIYQVLDEMSFAEEAAELTKAKKNRTADERAFYCTLRKAYYKGKKVCLLVRASPTMYLTEARACK